MYETNSFSDKLAIANVFYKQWRDDFWVKQLYNYVEGKQYKESGFGYTRYVVNEIYRSLEEKCSQQLIANPAFLVTPKAGIAAFNFEQAVKSAQQKQDLLNALITLPNTNFTGEMRRAFRDSFVAFGIIEVGYSADFRNPNSPASISTEASEDKSDGDPIQESELKAVKNPVPDTEQLFFRRIKHWRFRVSDLSAEDLDKVEWYGYYFYMNEDSLRRNAKAMGFKNIGENEDLNDQISYGESGTTSLGDSFRISKGVKIWKVWNNITKTMSLFLDHDGREIYTESFRRRQILDYRQTERTRGWYPIPPVSQWIPSQNSINESRNMMRSARKRAIGRWQALEGMVAPEEIDKFIGAEDISLTIVKRENAITPVPNQGTNPSIMEDYQISKHDFTAMTGITNNERGVSDRTTATEAQLINQAAQAREAESQNVLNKFYNAVATEILHTAIERMELPLMVRITGTPVEQFLMDMQAQGTMGQIVPAQLNDSFDFDVSVNVTDGSILSKQAQEQSFMKFLAVVSQFQFIATSPALIREAAYACNYRNETIIADMQQAALLMMAGQAAQGAQQGQNGAGGGGNNMAKRQIAQSSPNTVEQTRAQIDAQVGNN